MIIIKIQGGLGNQFFQYAFGRAFAIKKQCKLVLDTSDYQTNMQEKRKLSLDHFNVSFHQATSEDLERVGTLKNRMKHFLRLIRGPLICKAKEPTLNFNPKMMSLPIPVYFDGYWQNELYFKEIRSTLLQELQPRSISSSLSPLIEAIKRPNTVSVHVRRGDFLHSKNLKKHGVLPSSYYSKCLESCFAGSKSLHVYVFTDDPEWCRQNLDFKKSESLTWIHESNLKDYEELYLMSQAQSNIIANSSFSWWGAWLNERSDQQVYAPQKWYAGMDASQYDILPKSWNIVDAYE